jgi:hypothetical protein
MTSSCPLVDAHFDPCTRAFARLVGTIEAYRDHALEALLAYRSNQLRRGSLHRLRETDGFCQPEFRYCKISVASGEAA